MTWHDEWKLEVKFANINDKVDDLDHCLSCMYKENDWSLESNSLSWISKKHP